MSVPFSLFPTNLKTAVPPVPLWLYKCIAIFPVTGILGLDHYVLGSHFTGLLKLLVNTLTFGSWYAYDIVQVLYPSNIKENGLQVPFLEIGSIGKGRVDETPMSVMSKHTKLWIMISFVVLFGTLFFATSFFVTNESDTTSTALRWVSIFAFVVTIILFFVTLFYYLGGKIMNLIKPPAAASSVLTTTSLLPGTSILATGAPTIPSVSLPGMPSFSSVTPGSSIPHLSLGGGKNTNNELSNIIVSFGGEKENTMIELSNIAQEVIEGGSIVQSDTYDHITFPLIMALLPLSGFIIYTLRKNANKNEVS